jgi:5-hydroxyisourate hydrolase
VLDIASGKPAAGVRVTLGTRTLTTDGQGRIADLSGGGINPGSYRLLVEVGAYFGGTPHLLETIALELQLAESRHYHVPLLIAPYSCTIYRGT